MNDTIRFIKKVFVGKYKHSDNIDIRLEFISLVNKYLSNKGKSLQIDNLKKLWRILVKNNITSVEKGRFLTWIIVNCEIELQREELLLLF